VRTMMKWAAIPALFAVVACQDKPIDEGLASDLALIAGSDLELANASGAGALVISPVENIAVPAPKPTPNPSKARGKKAPPPTEVAVDAAAAEPTTTTPELVTVSESETPDAAENPAPDAPPIVRPRPVEPRYPVGNGSVYGSGRDEGVGQGGVTVVIRGGRTGRDPCDLHDIARRPGPAVGIMINNRIPTGTTFPRR
jgi:hypothetical protein